MLYGCTILSQMNRVGESKSKNCNRKVVALDRQSHHLRKNSSRIIDNVPDKLALFNDVQP